MSKKILILTPFPPNGCGGAETFVKALIKEAEKENEVTLCTLKARRKTWKGTGVLNLLSVFPILILKALFLICRTRIDVIHAQGLISGLIAVILKKIFKVKVFITLLALYEFDKWDIYSFKFQVSQWIIRSSDIIFVEGASGYFDITRRINADPKNIRMFNHWVDQEVFNPPQYRPSNKITVLFVGRPIPEKGRHIIEEAERIINDKEKYEFIYVDNCPHDELVRYYQKANILVVPSLYAEGYVRVVAEGASCGCMIITSQHGSLVEMVKDFGISLSDSPKDWAVNIKNLDIFHYGELSYEYAKNNFSVKNYEVFKNEYANV